MSSRNEVHINSALQLLQARKEALDRMNRFPMRPHGKVLGRDLFTWFDYQIDYLVSTILSFPYPVHWLGTAKEIEDTIRHEKEILDKLETIIIYDSTQFELPIELANKITNCISVDSIESALVMLRAVEQGEGEILITGNEAKWEENKDQIEVFIQTFKK